MNRIRRIALQLMEKYPTLFTTNYEHNKEVINKVAEFRSKELRNMVVGYITLYINRSRKRKEGKEGEESQN